MIKLVFSSDARGFSKSATVIASIIRRTSVPVHVRYWCSGFRPKDIEVGRLKVEFFEVLEDEDGRYPGHVPPAVFNRLLVIKECPDWDSCLVMDYDQLAFCDLAPLFDLDLGTHLLAAKMQGEGVDMAYAMREWIKQPFPKGWEHVADYAYFSMGPLLNLSEMRSSGTWEKLIAAHKAFGMDEQLSLTAATEGRTMGFDRKWNLFPDLDLSNDDVPDGVVHWTGWAKPWHYQSQVWRADLWQSERTTWDQLRLGHWEKPLAILVRCNDEQVIRSLMDRGWKVKVYESQCLDAGAVCECCQEGHQTAFKSYPDLEFASLAQLNSEVLCKASMVRIYEAEKLSTDQLDLLKSINYLILTGPLEEKEISTLPLTATQSKVIKRYTWPAGGAHPKHMEYQQTMPEKLEKDEDLYLTVSR